MRAGWFRKRPLRSEDPEVRSALEEALRLEDSGQHHEAETCLRKLVLARPHDPDPLLPLSAHLATQGEIEDAAWTAARAADLRKDDPHVVFRAAEGVRWFSLPAARDYIEHVKSLLAEASAENTFLFRADLLALEGLVTFDEGDREGGIRLLEQGHHVDPTNLSVARDLAEAYVKVGRRPDALAVIRDGLAMDPTDRGLRRLIEEHDSP
jgi:Flp pilus assembly protein TadD